MCEKERIQLVAKLGEDRKLYFQRLFINLRIKPSLKKFPIPFTSKKCQDASDLRVTEQVDSRRNTYEAKSTCSASTSCYPHSTDDHVEIDFGMTIFYSLTKNSIQIVMSRNQLTLFLQFILATLL